MFTPQSGDLLTILINYSGFLGDLSSASLSAGDLAQPQSAGYGGRTTTAQVPGFSGTPERAGGVVDVYEIATGKKNPMPKVNLTHTTMLSARSHWSHGIVSKDGFRANPLRAVPVRLLQSPHSSASAGSCTSATAGRRCRLRPRQLFAPSARVLHCSSGRCPRSDGASRSLSPLKYGRLILR